MRCSDRFEHRIARPRTRDLRWRIFFSKAAKKGTICGRAGVSWRCLDARSWLCAAGSGRRRQRRGRWPKWSPSAVWFRWLPNGTCSRRACCTIGDRQGAARGRAVPPAELVLGRLFSTTGCGLGLPSRLPQSGSPVQKPAGVAQGCIKVYHATLSIDIRSRTYCPGPRTGEHGECQLRTALHSAFSEGDLRRKMRQQEDAPMTDTRRNRAPLRSSTDSGPSSRQAHLQRCAH